MCCVMPPASRSATLRLADRVEQRRLAVVDVAHDRDDRRARLDVLGLRLLALGRDELLLEAPHLDLGAELAGDVLGGLDVERAVDGHHHALHQQLGEHVLDAHVELVGEILDRHALGERDGAGDRRRRRRRRRHRRRRRPLAPRLRRPLARAAAVRMGGRCWPNGGAGPGAPGMPGRAAAAAAACGPAARAADAVRRACRASSDAAAADSGGAAVRVRRARRAGAPGVPLPPACRARAGWRLCRPAAARCAAATPADAWPAPADARAAASCRVPRCADGSSAARSGRRVLRGAPMPRLPASAASRFTGARTSARRPAGAGVDRRRFLDDSAAAAGCDGLAARAAAGRDRRVRRVGSSAARRPARRRRTRRRRCFGRTRSAGAAGLTVLTRRGGPEHGRGRLRRLGLLGDRRLLARPWPAPGARRTCRRPAARCCAGARRARRTSARRPPRSCSTRSSARCRDRA